MFNEVMKALDEYVDLRLRIEREKKVYEGTSSTWHDHIAEKRKEAEKALHGALKAFVQFHSN